MSMSPPALDSSLGMVELGILVSTALYGVMTVQCYTYYQAGFKDTWLVKGLVIFVLLVETFHTVDLWVFLYKITITNFGDYESKFIPSSRCGFLVLITLCFTEVSEGHWTLGISIPATTLVTGAVQSFFAIRVYRLSHQLWYPIFSCTLCLVQLVGGFANFIMSLKSPTMPQFATEFLWLMAGTMVVAAVIDICNTVALCYCLHKGKADAAAPWSRRVVDKLIVWTIETGLLTSVLVLTMAITLLALPKDNFLFLFFFCVTTKMYSNSLLASLNNRISLRASYEKDDPHVTVQLSTFQCPERQRPRDMTETSLSSFAAEQTASVASKENKLESGTRRETFTGAV